MSMMLVCTVWHQEVADDICGCPDHSAAPVALEDASVRAVWQERPADDDGDTLAVAAEIREALQHPALLRNAMVPLRSDADARVLRATQRAGVTPETWLRQAVLQALNEEAAVPPTVGGGAAPVGDDDEHGPVCHHAAAYLNVHRDHCMMCHEHRLYWWDGSNLFSSWHDETPADWARHAALLEPSTRMAWCRTCHRLVDRATLHPRAMGQGQCPACRAPEGA